MESFIKNLPKVELHAHLNGSISQETIKSLVKMKKEKDPNWDGDKTSVGQEQSSFTDIFDVFKLIYHLTDSTDAVYIITRDVIEEFSRDNVRYLELRTTPRLNAATGMTKSTYIEAVLRGIDDCRLKHPNIIVTLILCINRTCTLEEANENLNLAVKYREKSPGTIVGLDLCGFPLAGDARNFIPVFREAKKNGFKLTLHLSEAENQNEETKAMLEEVKPDRIGHGVFLHPQVGGDEQLVSLVEKLEIPIEVCLTSNVKSKVVSSYDDHHFAYWYKKGHPLCLCTDDKGVFDTSLSQEYLLATKTFKLTKEEAWNLSYNAIDFIFGGNEVKTMLKAHWEEEKDAMLAK